MTKKILYFVLLSVLIMSVGYDIQTGRIQFGSSRINDSTSTLMTMNKGLLINGDLYTPDAAKFYIGDNYLNGLMNNMGYYSTTHTFYSQAGTSIATFDSASGITFAKDFIPAWTKNTSSVNSFQYEKVKIVSGILPNAVGGNPISITHGLNFNQIKSWTAMVKDDTTNVLYNPGQFYGAGVLFYARVDSLICRAEIGSAAATIANDSIFFRIVYTDFNR